MAGKINLSAGDCSLMFALDISPAITSFHGDPVEIQRVMRDEWGRAEEENEQITTTHADSGHDHL